jgi:hypothetical protein
MRSTITGMYTAIHTAARGALMQRLIRVELIIDS